MNVLHVCAVYPPFVGGASTYTAEISRRFAADGHAVSVLTTDIDEIDLTWSPRGRRAPPSTASTEGVRVVRMPVRHLPLAPLSFYAIRRLMPPLATIAPRAVMRALGRCVPLTALTPEARELLRQTFDLVHWINITMESPLLRAAAQPTLATTPALCTPFVHVGAPEVMRNYVMPHQIELMRRASRVFVQTELEGRALAQFNVPSASISQLGMGINLADTAGADGDRFRSRHGIPPNAPIVSFMGSITHDKGAVTLLLAMRQLWAAGLDAYLVLAGEQPGPGGFDKAFADTPTSMHSRVLRVGVLRGVDKHDMLAASSIFALPSRVDSFGIVYLEAWAHGVPVIGADAGGVPDVIAHEKDGFVLPFGDAAALAAHIRLLINQPVRAKSMGAAGRIKVATRFTWEAIYAKLANAYREAMQNRILTPS